MKDGSHFARCECKNEQNLFLFLSERCVDVYVAEIGVRWLKKTKVFDRIMIINQYLWNTQCWDIKPGNT
jgi:hypothetical protein